MCVGLPMQIVTVEGRFALCARRGETYRLDLALVGEQPPGTWVLAFLDAARAVIDPTQAREIDAALDGLAAAMTGDAAAIDAFFPDLAGRTPELPEHLRSPTR